MSYARSFRAPGGHIFDVVAQVLKKHVFTSELRMRLWTLRSLTDRNTPFRLKIDLGNLDITDFFASTKDIFCPSGHGSCIVCHYSSPHSLATARPLLFFSL